MAFENFWKRDRDRHGEERRSSEEWPERARGRRDFGGSGDDEREFDRRGWREGSDYYGNNDRRYESGSEGYGGQRRSGGRATRQSYGGSDWRDEGASYGGEFSAGSYTRGNFGPDRGDDEGSFGMGGYGRDLDDGRSRARGYGAMGGDETGSSAYGYEGRRQDHRGRGPRGYRRSDERIREDVCEALTDDSYLDASNMDVAVKDCEVTLSGTVSSREDKRRAEDIVERISGVRDVHNMLRVESGQRTQSTQSEAASTQSTTGSGQQARH